MESSKTFFKTAGLGVATKGMSAGIGVALSILLARLLGPSDYGVYVLYINIINVMVVLILLGLPQLVTREIAKKYNNHGARVNKSIYRKALKITFYCSIIYCPVFVGFSFIADFKMDFVVYLILIVLLTALAQLNASVIRGSHRHIIADIPLLITKPGVTLLLVLVLYILYQTVELKTVFVLVFFATLLSTVTSFTSLRKLDFLEGGEVNISGIKSFYLIAIVGVLEVQIPIYALSILDSNDSVAFYQIGFQLASLIIFVILSINNQIGSKISEAFYNKDMGYLQANLNNSLKFSFYYVFFVVPFFLLILFNVDFLYGQKYQEVSGVGLMILISQVINVFFGSSALVMNMSGNQILTLKMMVVSMFINVVGCLLLIPIFSYYGAAISALLAMFVWKMSLSYICYKRFGLKTYFRTKVLG